MNRIIVIVVLLVSVWLIYTYPHSMLNPGELVKGHQDLKYKCSSCHQSFLGVPNEKCISCHKPAEIGTDSTGKKPGINFHNLLGDKQCTSCHTDHKGIIPSVSLSKFDHSILSAADREKCNSCHAKPAGAFHAGIKENCSQCHGIDKWKPASFDHTKYFPLDEDHRASCETCHVSNAKFSIYSCYGCHEHSESNIREEHNEEGIYIYTDCMSCHRNGKSQEGGKSEGREGKGSGEEDD